MKIEQTGIAPRGHRIINLRVGVEELEIIRGLLALALSHTPKTSETAGTIQRMRAMGRCLNSEFVVRWIENPVAQPEEASDLKSDQVRVQVPPGSFDPGWEMTAIMGGEGNGSPGEAEAKD